MENGNIEIKNNDCLGIAIDISTLFRDLEKQQEEINLINKKIDDIKMSLKSIHNELQK